MEQLILHICDGYHGNYNFLEVSPITPRASWHVFFLYLINFANCTVWDLKPRALRWDFNILHMICSLRADSSNGSTSLSLRNTSKGMGRVAVRRRDENRVLYCHLSNIILFCNFHGLITVNLVSWGLSPVTSKKLSC